MVLSAASFFLMYSRGCFVDGDDALGVAIYETDCQNHDNSNNAIAEGYLEVEYCFCACEIYLLNYLLQR